MCPTKVSPSKPGPIASLENPAFFLQRRIASLNVFVNKTTPSTITIDYNLATIQSITPLLTNGVYTYTKPFLALWLMVNINIYGKYGHKWFYDKHISKTFSKDRERGIIWLVVIIWHQKGPLVSTSYSVVK